MTHAHGHGHGHSHHPASTGQAQMLDLEARVLSDHLADIAAWLPVETSPREILDLGCGTGAGTFALLARFPDARVTAADSSAEHLERLAVKARAAGVQERVRTVAADLDAPWPDFGTPDLVWASASMHHLADPGRALRTVHDILAPGGLLAVVELADFPRFLPTDAPADRPGLEDRCHAAAARQHARHMPHRGADWGPMLTGAGFDVVGRRTVDVAVSAAADDDAVSAAADDDVARYALVSLQRLRDTVADDLAVEDRSALDRLLDADDPHYLLRRDDLMARTERTVWAARPRATGSAGHGVALSHS